MFRYHWLSELNFGFVLNLFFEEKYFHVKMFFSMMIIAIDISKFRLYIYFIVNHRSLIVTSDWTNVSLSKSVNRSGIFLRQSLLIAPNICGLVTLSYQQTEKKEYSEQSKFSPICEWMEECYWGGGRGVLLRMFITTVKLLLRICCNKQTNKQTNAFCLTACWR